MDWRPLSARGNQVTDVKFDADGRIIIRERQYVDPVLDQNKFEMNNVTPGKEWRKIASVPNNIVHKWLQEGIDIFSGEHQDAVARKLNDPDNRYLRTAPGCIGVSNGVAR